ncbi:hypothetical protein SprV_0401584300 [Sparganum proliferum]
MAEEFPSADPYCNGTFAAPTDCCEHVESADCSSGDYSGSGDVLPSSPLSNPPDTTFLSQPLTPSAFHSPDTPRGSASSSLVNNGEVGACKVSELAFHASADSRAHLYSEEHKAGSESAAHSANEPVAEQRTKAAACQACGLDFNTIVELKAHLSTQGHVARVEHVTQQGRPVSPSPRHLRCMCCDMTFPAISELRRHLASHEHVQRAEKMRLSNDRLPCKSSATVSHIDNTNVCDNRIQMEQNHPPPLAPQTFRSPVTPTGNVSIPPVNREKVGACKACGLVFYVSADLKAHLYSEEHKARIESAARSTNEPLAVKRTKVASCQACGVDFHVKANLIAHLASPEHAARVNYAVQQETPVPLSRGLLCCMCCDMTFLAKSELQQHLTTQEHLQKAERMRQNDDKLLCTSYATAEATAFNTNSNNALDGEVQLDLNLPQALPGNEELTALVKKLCEEMRPFIRSEICRLLDPIFAP